jgi:hypothetical protein
MNLKNKPTQAILGTGSFVWDCELYRREIANLVSDNMIMMIHTT